MTDRWGTQVIRVFFSYSHKDENLRDSLDTHLSMLKNEGLIDVWHDRRIGAGQEIDSSISSHLEAANIILLLVSADFLASAYCWGVEVARAMERHHAKTARVIPIILRACDWHSAPFGKLNAAPRDGKAIKSWPDLDEAFLDVTRQIREAVKSLAPVAAPIASARPPVAPSTRTLGSIVAPERSSNLQITKTFSDRDRDAFALAAFEYMANFFSASLDELSLRNPDIEGTFRRIDGNHFSAVAYRGGKAVCRCRVWLGSPFGCQSAPKSRPGSASKSMPHRWLYLACCPQSR